MTLHGIRKREAVKVLNAAMSEIFYQMWKVAVS